jgi:hypothetical protein
VNDERFEDSFDQKIQEERLKLNKEYEEEFLETVGKLELSSESKCGERKIKSPPDSGGYMNWMVQDVTLRAGVRAHREDIFGENDVE